MEFRPPPPGLVLLFLLVPFLLGAAMEADPADDAIGGLPLDGLAEPGVTFDALGGNAWWLQARLSGPDVQQVASVQAMDTGGPWVALAAQAWSSCDCWWAGSFQIESGHQVRLRATLQDGSAAESCWSSHPAGLAACGSAGSDGGPLGAVALEPLAPGAGQVVVGFAAGRLPSAAAGQSLAGLPVLARIDQLDALVLQASGVAIVEAALGALPGILYIEADGAVRSLGVPNDPRYGGQYGPGLAGFPAAWDTAGYGSSNVTVAVIDSGLTRSHPDLQGSRIRAGYDYVNRDGIPDDACGHGTHVTGIVGASTDNGVGVAGASQASLLPLKVLGRDCSGSLSNVARAVADAADQGADVITMSLGTSSNSRVLADAVAYAWNHGALVVAAAGNSGGDNSVHYPAAYSQVIAVSALDRNKALASYSSRGPKIEVAAPGSQIDSTTKNGAYGLMSGTSMATPLVAGSLALALSCAPEASNDAVRRALASSAQDLGPAGRDSNFGFGLVRADALVAALCNQPPPSNRPPIATFSSTQQGLAVTVDGRSSSDADGDTLSFGWTFGDGSTAATPRADHTFAQAGVYTVTLTVNDGALSATRATNLTVVAAEPSTFAPQFTLAKGCNEWWVEVFVSASQPLVAVGVSVEGGPWQALPKTSWGPWAASFHVAKGASVVFQASDGSGQFARSVAYDWLGAPPPSGPFTAVFSPKTLNNSWWVEVGVEATQPVSQVQVQMDEGSWTTLPRTDWGTWAKSLHVLPGTQVTFRATSAEGVRVTSATYTWR